MSTLFFFTCESSAISLLYNCLKARVNSMTFLRPNIIVSRRASVFKSEMLNLEAKQQLEANLVASNNEIHRSRPIQPLSSVELRCLCPFFARPQNG